MPKEVIRESSLQLPTAQARPGASLSSLGISMPAFCKEFNDSTSVKKDGIQPGINVSVRIRVFSDKSFTFKVKKQTIGSLLKSLVSISGEQKILSHSNLEKLIDLKISDLNTTDREKARKIIIGSIRSSHIILREE